MSGGYATASVRPRAIPRIIGANKIKRARYTVEEKRPMKLTFREKLRNWLLKDDSNDCEPIYAEDCDNPDLDSQNFRLKVYGASGGTIIETTKYDRKSDENRHSLYVVTEDKDLGQELAKIITMEQLR
jgi:hypothetical protein